MSAAVGDIACRLSVTHLYYCVAAAAVGLAVILWSGCTSIILMIVSSMSLLLVLMGLLLSVLP